MPPRAARAPKRDSVAVAVRKNLSPTPAARAAKKGTTSTSTTTATAAAAAAAAAAAEAKETASATRTRVTRRKAAVVPQDAPEWQRQALHTAAASVKLQRKTANNRKTAAKKSPSTAVKEAKKAKGREFAASSDSDDGDHDAASSGAPAAEIEACAGNASGRGKAKTATPQRKRAPRNKADADGTPTTAKRAPKKKAAMLCPRCKLHMGHWPFCGLSGEPHLAMEEEAAEGESAAASPTTAAE